jgi:predicted GNAT superfamily acetyltransferase
MFPEITIRPLHSLDDFQRCVQIARQIWSDADLETEPVVTYVIAHHTGGQILGAFDGDTMVGFTKAYVGLHEQTPYLHSHMAGVLPSHRDRHIGRQLKLFQREDALRRDIRRIEWTFDPLEVKNAYFNLNRLGAISRRYIRNFYGITTSPLHRGMPTDRLLVEWHLDSRRVIAAINNLTPTPQDCPAQIHLPNPIKVSNPGNQISADLQARKPTAQRELALDRESEGWSANPSPLAEQLIELQSRLRQEFTHWFNKGYAVTSLCRTPPGVGYCLSPYSDF